MFFRSSSEALDVVTTERLDPGITRLLDLVREHIREGVFWPFEGTIIDQDGNQRCAIEGRLSPADVIAMDWLVDNVIGGFPDTESLRDEARAMVELQGIREIKLPDASTFSWRSEE